MTAAGHVAESIRLEIAAMLDSYIVALDDDRLEAWPEYFLADGLYKILSRENVSLGLPAPLMYYYSQGMMQDRVRALREALTYQPAFYRHLVSAPQISAGEPGEFLAGSNFALYLTTEEGVSELYTTGRYADVIVLTGSGPKFRSRIVTMDTFGVRNLISVPL